MPSGIIDRIKQYLNHENTYSIAVDAESVEELNDIKDRLSNNGTPIINVSDFCHDGGMPNMPELKEFIQNRKEKSVLISLSPYLWLKGLKEGREEAASLLSLPRTVILTLGCHDFFKPLIRTDPRMNGRILLSSNSFQDLPKIVFVSESITSLGDKTVKDFGMLLQDAENACGKICLSSYMRKKDFPESLCLISDFTDPLVAIKEADSFFGFLNGESGTEQNFIYLLRLLEKYRTAEQLIEEEFGGIAKLEFLLNRVVDFSPNDKWLFFILLKNSPIRNKCLKSAVSESASWDIAEKRIAECIVDKDINDSDFQVFYKQRRDILKDLTGWNPLGVISKANALKGRDAIWSMTSLTKPERENIFRLLSEYEYSYDEIRNFADLAWKDLLDYLEDYDFENGILNEYFRKYKYQKVTNRIDLEFMDKIRSGEFRNFYSFAPSRISILENIESSLINDYDKRRIQGYFVDALGVEFLSYISKKCAEKKLFAEITICRSELPSITSVNKDFKEFFEGRGFGAFKDVKDLDELKHKEKGGFSYEKTKLPLHLEKELEAVDGLVSQIASSLHAGDFDKAVIFSDHGASRMPVISGEECVYRMAEKGEHSGRCCRKSESDEQPPNCVDAGEYWALADYSRFKGSVRRGVEMHGGASLEEVIVPVIEISVFEEPDVLPVSNVIKSLPKTGAVLEVRISRILKNVYVKIDGHSFNMRRSDESGIYSAELSGVKGDVSADFYSGANLIKSGIRITVNSGIQKKNMIKVRKR